jgi:hypothetical protein
VLPAMISSNTCVMTYTGLSSSTSGLCIMPGEGGGVCEGRWELKVNIRLSRCNRKSLILISPREEDLEGEKH